MEHWREKLQHIRVRTGRLPPNITPRLNGYAKVKSGWHLDLRCLSACWERVSPRCSGGLFTSTTCARWFIQVGIKRLRCAVTNVKKREKKREKSWKDSFCSSCLCARRRGRPRSLSCVSVFRAKWDASGSLGQKCLSLWDWGELAGSLQQPWKGSGLRGTF